MMIQDLDGKKLYNEYEKTEAQPGDQVFCFDMDKMYIKEDADGNPSLLTAADFPNTRLQYLFRIEENRYFLAMDEDDKAVVEQIEGVTKQQARNLRDLTHKELAFAAATAYHLHQWYRDNKFCGRCGFRTQHGAGERMLKCPSCGNAIYPKIAPAVIVGLTDGDRLMMTHLNDNLGISRFDGTTYWTDDLHLLPFDGIADWSENVQRLKHAAPQEYLNFELTTASKPDRHENDVYAALPPEVYLAEAYKRACRIAWQYAK